MAYIHYGHLHFDRALFEPVRNKDKGNKPDGGLWASDEDTENGWKDWNATNEYRECDEDNAFRFVLKPEARVFVIDSVAALDNIPRCREVSLFAMLILGGMGGVYDWEEMARKYDAVDFRLSADSGLYDAMYGWDCDSLLVLNPEIVEELPA